VGALPHEVVFMNTLTVNLNLLMASFYRPTPQRPAILCEGHSFPSDRYALLGQLRLHCYSEADLIEVFPAEGADTPTTAQFLEVIEKQGDRIALLLLGGVNYYTGQLFDIPMIAAAARARGIVVGLDLAHAVGNVRLSLHDWDIDFAAWCSYKYLNGGPGAVGGIFVHERHGLQYDGPRLLGWWGHEPASRFAMPPDFRPMPGAEGWQNSNPPILSMTPLRASLPLFQQAGWEALEAKSRLLTGLLRHNLLAIEGLNLRILTPEGQSGCQLSVYVPEQGRKLFDHLTEQGVVADWREPHVIRLAPVPLYSTFSDIYRCVEAFRTFAAVYA
jgi:kynureninase